MRFIIDAQLPYGLKSILQKMCFDTIHTDDLPNKERTTDNDIRNIAVEDNRIVISKDSDFMDSYYIKRIPKQLLIITTGNIRNIALYNLFEKNLGSH